MKDRREVWIDNVKGFAILLVILGHIEGSRGDLQNWIYSFHMPLFFCVSGYLYRTKALDYSRISIIDFACKKAKRLMYPYLTFTVIAVVYQAIRLRGNEVLDALVKTITLQGYSTLWFLPTMFLAECLFFLYERIRHKKKTIIIGVLIVLCSLASCYVKNNTLLIVINRCLMGTVFMIVGSIAWWLYEKIEEKEIDSCVGIISFVIIVVNVFWACENSFVDMHFAIINEPVLYWWIAITTSMGVMFLFKKYIIKKNILAFYGKHSLSAMCISSLLPVIGGASAISNKLVGIENSLVGLISTYFISLILTGILVLLADKYCPFVINMPLKRKRK